MFPGSSLSSQIQVLCIGTRTGIKSYLHLSKGVCIQDSEKATKVLGKKEMRDEMAARIDASFLLNVIVRGILPDELEVPTLAPIRKCLMPVFLFIAGKEIVFLRSPPILSHIVIKFRTT